MEEHVYKLIELTGTSAESTDKAIENALSKAAESVKHMRWFKVLETRGAINGGSVEQWQVTIRVGFTIEDS